MELKIKESSIKSNSTTDKLSNILSGGRYARSYISRALAEREKEKKKRAEKDKERKREKHKEKKPPKDKRKIPEKDNEITPGKYKEKKLDQYKDRNTEKQREKQKEKEKSIEKGRNKEKVKKTEKDTERNTEKHKEKKREKSLEKVSEKESEKRPQKGSEKRPQKGPEKRPEKGSEKSKRKWEKGKDTETERDTSKGKVNVLRKQKHQMIKEETVEKQLKKLVEHLYSLKFKLEKEKASKVMNTSCLKRSKSANVLGNETLVKAPPSDVTPTVNFTDQKCVFKNIDRTSSVASHIPELIKTVEIYKNRNVEEKRNNRFIINKYESMIRNIKKQHIDEINEIKNTILEDVDFLIQKYRNVALELLEITKRKEKKNEAEKKKITQICITACKKFEEDVKQKAKASLQDYKTYMMEQNESIKREKELLQKKINDMKKHLEQEKYLIEKQIFESCDKKLKDEVAMNKKLKNQLIFERQQHNGLIGSLYSKIDEQIKVYEENFIKVAHDILAKNNVTMSIYELQDLIKIAMDKQYQKDQMEMEQKRKELENNKMNIKCGFTSVYDN